VTLRFGVKGGNVVFAVIVAGLGRFGALVGLYGIICSGETPSERNRGCRNVQSGKPLAVRGLSIVLSCVFVVFVLFVEDGSPSSMRGVKTPIIQVASPVDLILARALGVFKCGGVGGPRRGPPHRTSPRVKIVLP